MIRYAIVIRDDPELFGYIDCEVRPDVGMLLDIFEGQQTQAMIASIDPDRWQFHALH